MINLESSLKILNKFCEQIQSSEQYYRIIDGSCFIESSFKLLAYKDKFLHKVCLYLRVIAAKIININ
ncbi:hypothetical protein BpHYR1_004534 [Brachionus plicatilis]|uniref:Uncharacterized protein n=1 Tax=Brachionus plicatilis TaxID=10195 RepID=A0A3M7Q9Q5_BRAPC|nr:hypothetical protein BpHYR1_004534 [Brachionus plicatilis]